MNVAAHSRGHDPAIADALPYTVEPGVAFHMGTPDEVRSGNVYAKALVPVDARFSQKTIDANLLFFLA